MRRGEGAKKGGTRGGTSKKAAEASAGAKDRGRERQRDGAAAKGGERQKGEGAECMEIRSHAIQL